MVLTEPRTSKAFESTVDAMIDARGVNKTYESGRIRVEALKDIDFQVLRGEMVAIMGPLGMRQDHIAQLSLRSGYDRHWFGPNRRSGTLPDDRQ
jgi:ABC-type dipeptide/oligopeptide/nickel transport system ATPase subunit